MAATLNNLYGDNLFDALVALRLPAVTPENVHLEVALAAHRSYEQIVKSSNALQSKEEGLTASEYYRKIRGFADAMASIGKTLNDEEVLGCILAGLGPEFEPLVASVTARDDYISLSSFYALLLNAELRHEQQFSFGEIHSSANVAPCNSDGRDAGRGNQGGQPEDQRERSGNTANTGSYIIDTDWYTDTGATGHLTSDLDRLAIHERYGGKDKVHVANGAGLSNEVGSCSRYCTIATLRITVAYGPDVSLDAPYRWACITNADVRA
ncbi:uncharacterized protein [Aegilops tauschii subsp. strangulata]|uniref:uncharacterized protein n=1 Tax=Aegilops tauschii subsp. strangulata TaxID=200361 RepID=UPI003CC8C484